MVGEGRGGFRKRRGQNRWQWESEGASNYSMQRPQTGLLLSLKNQICQQLDGGQEALVSGQWAEGRGGKQLLELIEYFYLSKQQVSCPISAFVTCCLCERGTT